MVTQRGLAPLGRNQTATCRSGILPLSCFLSAAGSRVYRSAAGNFVKHFTIFEVSSAGGCSIRDIAWILFAFQGLSIPFEGW